MMTVQNMFLKQYFGGWLALSSAMGAALCGTLWMMDEYLVYDAAAPLVWNHNPHFRHEAIYIDQSEYVFPWLWAILAFLVLPLCWTTWRLFSPRNCKQG